MDDIAWDDNLPTPWFGPTPRAVKPRSTPVFAAFRRHLLARASYSTRSRPRIADPTLRPCHPQATRCGELLSPLGRAREIHHATSDPNTGLNPPLILRLSDP